MQTDVMPLNPANRLGLHYLAEAGHLPWHAPITDAHIHISGPSAAKRLFAVADAYGVQRVWSQSPLEEIDALRDTWGDRIEFVAVPNYTARDKPDTFTSDWLRRLERFGKKGVRIAKFWAGPRGRDLSPALRLDHEIRIEGMRLARDMGMRFMVHVADPDTWFSSVYRDHHRYDLKLAHYDPLERLLDEFADVPWLAAHMAGHPEDLNHVQQLLDRHPNLYVDTSATKWMVRELSPRIEAFAAFCRRNPGRVLFGSDIVASDNDPPDSVSDLFASRYWALRMMLESNYAGPSPIVDPDLVLMNPAVGPHATATLRGANLDPATLASLYQFAAEGFLSQKLPGSICC